MSNSIKQGVVVVDAFVTDERDVSRTIQENISKAITQLNAERKRVVSISSGPAIKVLFGMNHITYILWERIDDYEEIGRKLNLGNHTDNNSRAENSNISSSKVQDRSAHSEPSVSVEKKHESRFNRHCSFYNVETKACTFADSDSYNSDCYKTGYATNCDFKDYGVILNYAGGSNVYNVIREMRSLLDLDLETVQDYVSNTPSVIKEGISKAEAERIKTKLESVGARVEIE